MNEADLHIHTHYSDGQATPQELLEQADRHGLKAIAITDHETAQGNREGQKIASRYRVELIPAIEINTYWDGYIGHGDGPDIDILGYFIDLESEALKQAEASLHQGVLARAENSCELLRRAGYDIKLEDVLQTNASYPGYLALQATLLRLREAASTEEASEAVSQVYYVAGASALSIAEAIKVIHDAGGAAVLAHPSIIHRQSDAEPLTERGVMDLARMGLDGIEVYHYRLDERRRRHFSMLAKMFRLLVSGGSDEHRGPENFRRFGSEPVTMDMVNALRAKATSR